MRAERSRIVVVSAVLAACSTSKPEAEAGEAAPPIAVTCTKVTARDIDDALDVTGVIAPPPKLDAVIASPVAGRVASVAVEEGDRVSAGAVLASVEDPALPAGSVEARAGVASARAAQQAAEQDVARQQRLVDSGIGARRDLDDARAKATAAAAEVDAAGARDQLASQRLARRELRAPHAGVVLHVWKRAGESVDGTAGTPIAEVADTSVLELRAQVSPAVLVAISDGLAAHVRAVGIADELDGSVVRVSPSVDPTTLLGTVRIRIATTRALPVGSAASARIVVARRPGVVVPASALRRSAVGTDEVVTCSGDVAKVHEVTIGHRDDHEVEIAKGLAATDLVVTDHVLGIEDGRKLRTDAPDTHAAPAADGGS